MNIKNKFEKIFMSLRNPYLLERTALIDFLLDVKEKVPAGKFTYLDNFTDSQICKSRKDKLIVLFDQVRNRVHSNAELLKEYFPNLDYNKLREVCNHT